MAIPAFRDGKMDFLDSYAKIRKFIINARIPEWILIMLLKSNFASAIKLDTNTGKID